MAAIATILIVMIIILAGSGRRFWCECGSWIPWSWDIWTSHNSQHLIDPYFFSHVLHGLIFYGFLRWISRFAPTKLTSSRSSVVAVFIEAAWEVLENSPLIINRYRESTLAVGYTGDSIANSLTDVAACMLGFAIASRVSWRASVSLFVATELILLLTIRDNLTLNILMLITPIPSIQAWQTP